MVTIILVPWDSLGVPGTMWDYFEVTGTLSVSYIFTVQAFQPIFLSKTTFKYWFNKRAMALYTCGDKGYER